MRPDALEGTAPSEFIVHMVNYVRVYQGFGGEI
jgi:hypothetical protein